MTKGERKVNRFLLIEDEKCMKKPSIPMAKTMIVYWDCIKQLLVAFKQLALL